MKPDYGLDRPILIRNLAIAGVVLLAGGMILRTVDWPFVLPLLAGALCLAGAAWHLLGSKVGKVRLREGVIDSLRLDGTERVLDLGCGRGLMMLGIAHRLQTGRAVGVDCWDPRCVLHNDRKEVLYNARAEQVEERIEVHTGDLGALPFPECNFHVVVSTWGISCLRDPEARRKALTEACRVLRPGGKLLIVDVLHARAYAQVLQDLGMQDVKVSDPNFLFVLPSYRVTARRPLE